RRLSPATTAATINMKSILTRRAFIKRATLASGTLSATGLLTFPNLLAAAEPGRKLNCVQIGCGGRGLTAHIDWIVNTSKDNLIAIVDPDEKRQAEVKRFLKTKEADADKLEVFTDYRKMFDKI